MCQTGFACLDLPLSRLHRLDVLTISRLLLVFSVVSFVPQTYRTITRANSSGISTYYLLFNLISTIEQFTLAFFYIENNFGDPEFFVHSPINAGDWLNLAQEAVVVILWLTLFVICLYLPSDHLDGSAKFAITTYIAFLLISVVPLFIDAMDPKTWEDRKWPMALFLGIHSLYLSWIITAFNIAAFYYQAKQILSRPPQDQALAQVRLAIQAFVFAFMAVSWIGRVRFPYEEMGGFPWAQLSTWYELVGWAAVDRGIFALGQAVLLWMVKRRGASGSGNLDGETEPLLGA
ncbi:uncharacterized protein EI97DRAFT_410356 [Westerdykella ornata]|uniref:Uncharacterized protein n=1 Tax=Westerdykella ornata TaxID=318751 RepID=A0A6A6JYK3_WESOR|nr:uncharacterized protein EI97DRAFT_410356 [Westerdykella ornata]KAF2281487.1 hypothetical protein EI97DRAFT_410356 [Westerdykella ornata]